VASDLALLRADLTLLSQLLGDAGESRWVQVLSSIAKRLEEPGGRRVALQELLAQFGGMDTLNDLVFCEANRNIPAGRTETAANRELNQLLDRIFREASLYWANESDRAERLSWEASAELPPRVQNAFRKRN